MKNFAAALAVCLAFPAGAESPMSGDSYIDDRLLAAAISDEIRKKCSSISPRIIRFYLETRKLKRYANGKGYSDAEIKRFLNSEPVIEYLTERRDAYLIENGVTPGDGESYCVLGRKEIERGSLSGNLLRSR